MGEGRLKSSNSSDTEFVFGGTFDPIHRGHLAIIKRLEQISKSTPVRIIPCAIPPLKLQPNTSFEDRVTMLRLATQEFSSVIIDERESLRQRPSYTVETLQQLHQEIPNRILVLVMGMDTLADIGRWYQWQMLSQMCHLLVLNRPGIQIIELESHIQNAGYRQVETFAALKTAANGLAMCVNMPEMLHSSTQIRGSIDSQQPLDSLLPRSVIEYIHQHQLYQSEIN